MIAIDSRVFVRYNEIYVKENKNLYKIHKNCLVDSFVPDMKS